MIFTKESDGREGGDLSARILVAEESKDAAIILTPIDVTDLSKIVLSDAIILHSISSCTVMDFFLSFFLFFPNIQDVVDLISAVPNGFISF